MTEQSRHERLTALAIDQFQNHVIRSSGEDRWTLMKPYKDGKGYDSNLWVEIVILRAGGLLVTGDIDSVIFRYFSGPEQKPNDRDYQHSILRWMGNHKVDSYMVEKASIGAGDGGFSCCTFSKKAAREDCLENFYQYAEDTLLDDLLYEVDIEVDIYDNATRRAFVDGTMHDGWKTPESLKTQLLKEFGKDEEVSQDQFDTMGGVCSFYGASIPDVLLYIKNHVEDNEIGQVWKEASRYAEGSSMLHAITFNNRLYEDLEEAGLDDVFEYVGKIGVVPSCHLYYAWAAIRRLLEILEAEERVRRLVVWLQED